jgi:uncharacterized protein YndB with AHSA1/START domain
MSMRDVRFVHVSIEAPLERVYAFVADPRNLPRWAPNFGHTISRDGDGWVMETAEGPVPVRFVEPNTLGVLDHWVRLPDGQEVHNPIRVVQNGTGSVIAFTVSRLDGWSDDQLAQDVALVHADLARLKALLEA